MIRNLFKKKEESLKIVELKAYATGKVVKIEDVPDPVFSEKMMGEGIAIIPSEGEIVSPVDGEVIQIFPTKHAVGIKTNNGIEILIHVGLETVLMNGEGFSTHVTAGEKVKTGDLLVKVNLDLVKEKGKDIITPIVITNSDLIDRVEKPISSDIVTAAKQTILKVTAK
jgi:sugar PTS system EIIA component